MWRAPDNLTEDESLHNRGPVFQDRIDAARRLAPLMPDLPGRDVVVAGIPAGGIPLAVTLADILKFPLSVLVVSKLTLPWNTEAGYGAVAADDTLLLNEALIRQVQLEQTSIDQGVRETTEKVRRRQKRFTDVTGAVSLAGKTVMIVDDGLASGFTLRVAIASARSQGAKNILVAIPTGHASAARDIAAICDHLYCANVREGLRFAVADAYEEWRDISEDEALSLVQQYIEKRGRT